MHIRRYRLLGFAHMIAPKMSDPEYPLANVPVTQRVLGESQQRRSSHTSEGDVLYKEPLPHTLRFIPLREFYKDHFRSNDPADVRAIIGAVREALAKYEKSVDNVIERVNNIRNDDIEGLLNLTGTGFGPVIHVLEPRLVKSIRTGSPERIQLVPDETALAFVRGINDLFIEWGGVKKLSEADTDLWLAVGSLIPVALPARIVGEIAIVVARLTLSTADVADVAFRKIPQIQQQADEVAFAKAASVILGSQRLDMAKAAQTPMWANLLAIGSAGFGLKADVLDAVKGVNIAVARSRAAKLLSIFEDEGLDAFKKMSKNDQSIFLASVLDAKVTKDTGVKAITDADRVLQNRFANAASQFGDTARSADTFDNPFAKAGLKRRVNSHAGRPKEATIIGAALNTRTSVANAVENGMVVVEGLPAEGRFLYVVDSKGRMYIDRPGLGHDIQHSSLVPDGEKVYAAGKIDFSRGHPTVLDAESGHYFLDDQLLSSERERWVTAMEQQFREIGLDPPWRVIPGIRTSIFDDLLDVPEGPYSDAIFEARRAAGGMRGDCEGASSSLGLTLGEDAVTIPWGAQGRPGHAINHRYVRLGKGIGDIILDPTAAQYIKPGMLSETQVIEAGLAGAIKSGVFRAEQHEAFRALLVAAVQ